MVTRLGTRLGTSLGTELGEFADVPGPPVFDPTKIYAVGGYSAGNAYTTQPDGGEAGVGTGYVIVNLVYFAALPLSQQMTYKRTTAGALAGYQKRFTGAGALVFTSSTGAAHLDATLGFSSTDAGRIHLICGIYDATRAAITADKRPRVLGGTGAYGVPAAGSLMRLSGDVNNSEPAAQVAHLAQVTIRGVPTDAELSALCDAARTIRDLPDKPSIEALMPSCTVTHRWSVRDTLQAALVPVVSGAAAPASLPDSVTAASVDAYGKTGSPVVRVLDPSMDGRTSYGTLGFATATYLETSGGVVGSTAGFHVAARFDIPLTSATDVLVSRESAPGTAGYSIYVSTTAVSFLVANGSAYVVATCAVPAGRRQLTFLCRYSGGSGGTARVAVDGVEGSAVALGGNFSPLPGTVMRIGAKSLASSNVPATTCAFFAANGGDLPLSDVEAAAFWAQVAPGLALPRTAGKTQHEWDVTQDVIANGGPANGVPATILDRVGTDNLTRVGSGLVPTPRTERLWTYETTPLAYGTSGLTATAFYENTTPGIMPGSTLGFWGGVAFIADTQGAGSTRSLLSSQNGALGGFDLRTTNHATATLSFIDNTGTGRSSPLATIAATDLGKVLLLVALYDPAGPTIRTYWKRAEVSTGTAVSGYLPSPVGVRLGNHTLGGQSPNTTILGAAYGVGVPTLAQVQALFDAVAANDGRMQAIPGLTSSLYDLTQDASGGTIGASIADRAGAVTLTRAGSPTTTARYNRAMAW